jgi:hypothetical protein
VGDGVAVVLGPTGVVVVAAVAVGPSSELSSFSILICTQRCVLAFPRQTDVPCMPLPCCHIQQKFWKYFHLGLNERHLGLTDFLFSKYCV